MKEKILKLEEYQVKCKAEDIVDFKFEGVMWQSIFFPGVLDSRCKITIDDESLENLKTLRGLELSETKVGLQSSYDDKTKEHNGLFQLLFIDKKENKYYVNFKFTSRDEVRKVERGLPIIEERYIPNGLLETMVGKDKTQVKEELRSLDFDCEIVEEDGIHYICTCDIRSDRARMRVKDGKVVKIWVE